MAHGPQPNMHHLVDVSEFSSLVEEEMSRGDNFTQNEMYPGVTYDPISEAGRTALYSLTDPQDMVLWGENIA